MNATDLGLFPIVVVLLIPFFHERPLLVQMRAHGVHP